MTNWCLKKQEKKSWLARIVSIAFYLVSGFILFSCAAPAIKTTALVPARFHQATTLKEVAVLPFDGPEGKAFSAEIEGVLAGVNIDDKQYFTLIDRTKLDKILNEQALSQTGAIDESTAAKVGKLVGAKGIYTGVITARNIANSPYTEERQDCSQYQTKYDNKGNAYQGNCISYRKWTVQCNQANATFSFTPKLISVESGTIIYSNNCVGTALAKGCPDDKGLPNAQLLLAKAMSDAKMAFKQDVAPNYVNFTIRLMESNDGVTSKEAVEKMGQALDFAKHNRLDRSCELWGEARILSPSAPALLYNLGVCAETRGDLENALDLFKKADRALNKPNDLITAAIGRASEGIKKQQILKEQIKK